MCILAIDKHCVPNCRGTRRGAEPAGLAKFELDTLAEWLPFYCTLEHSTQ